MIGTVFCWLVAFYVLVAPLRHIDSETIGKLDDQSLSEEERLAVAKQCYALIARGVVYSVTFLVIGYFLGLPVLGTDDEPKIQLEVMAAATNADADLEPVAFIDWLHAQPDRANDPWLIKAIDRWFATSENALDIAHAKPYKIAQVQAVSTVEKHVQCRLFVHAQEAATPLQRSQTLIKAALKYRADSHNYSSDPCLSGWDIEAWLVADAKNTDTCLAKLSYHRYSKTKQGDGLYVVMKVGSHASDKACDGTGLTND